MPYAKTNQAISGLDGLAKTIAIPREHKAERIPTFPALERTGVLSFTDTKTVTVPSESSLQAMVCRDPAFPVWATQALSGSSSIYSMITGSGDAFTVHASNTQLIPIGPLANFYTNTGSVYALSPYTTPILTYHGERYFYNMTGRVGFEFWFLTSPGVTGMAASLAIIDSKQEITNHVISTAMWLSGTTVGFSIALPAGTVGFRLTDLNINVTTSATVASLAYGITTETASSAVPLSAPTGAGPSVLFPICKPVEAASTTVPWKAVRSTAVGALFSNVTAVMNKEGTIKCARVSSESTSCLAYQNFDTAIDTVYPKDRYFGAMENGLYTFTLPDTGSESYRDVLVNGTPEVAPVWPGSQAYVANFDMDKLAYANIIVFTDIGTSDSTLAITVDRHIEFRSSSVLFPLGYSRLQLETYHAAQMALVQLGVFFENPVHLSLISAAVASAVRSVAAYAYPVVKQVGQAALIAAGDKILSLANKKLGQMSQAKMVKQPAVKPQRVVVTRHTRAKVQKRR
jgi:hypothetical protein